VQELLMVVVVMVLMLAFQLPLLIKERQWGELAAFLTLWLVASVYASLLALDVELPRQAQILIKLLGSK
jgi:hypothetical protein